MDLFESHRLSNHSYHLISLLIHTRFHSSPPEGSNAHIIALLLFEFHWLRCFFHLVVFHCPKLPISSFAIRSCCPFISDLHTFPSRGRQPAALGLSPGSSTRWQSSRRKINCKLLYSSKQTKSFIGSTMETLCFNTVSFISLDSSIICNRIKMSLITASDAERQGLCFTTQLKTSAMTSSSAQIGEIGLLGDTLSYVDVFF